MHGFGERQSGVFQWHLLICAAGIFVTVNYSALTVGMRWQKLAGLGSGEPVIAFKLAGCILSLSNGTTPLGISRCWQSGLADSKPCSMWDAVMGS